MEKVTWLPITTLRSGFTCLFSFHFRREYENVGILKIVLTKAMQAIILFLEDKMDEKKIQAVQRRLAEINYEAWQCDFRHLQKQIHASGGFGLGETKEEVITNVRKIRQQIFEEEYADLY